MSDLLSSFYFCKHLNYSISAATAQKCYYLQSDSLCKNSNCPCTVLEESKLNTLLASQDGPLIREVQTENNGKKITRDIKI